MMIRTNLHRGMAALVLALILAGLVGPTGYAKTELTFWSWRREDAEARTDARKTLPLGMTVFFGQYETNWGVVFAGMVLASLPLLGLYFLMSRQFIKGLTAGAVKG